MKTLYSLFLILVSTTVLVGQNLSERVLVLYNTNYSVDQNMNGTPDGLELADYYQAAHGVPAENIFGVAVTTDEEMGREEYDGLYDIGGIHTNHLKQVVEDYLHHTSDAAGTPLKDKIYFIVLTKGMPLKIRPYGSGSDVNTADNSSLSASLSLLFQNVPIAGRLSNPYFNPDPGNTKTKSFRPFTYSNNAVTLSYLVTRIDAYSVESAKDIIDRAVNAQLSSTSVFVLDDDNKPYDYMFNAYWGLKYANQHVVPDPWSDSPAWITTASQPVMGYASHGTYAAMPPDYINSTLNFQWASGALFVSYESYNAQSFRTTSPHGQLADFINAGGTGGVGYVYEPWTSGMAHEEVLFPMYSIGYTLAEAAYMSMPYLSWTVTVAGDPLCRVADAPATLSAEFSTDVITGVAPLAVSFTDASTAQGTVITSWSWDFDNDQVSDAAGPAVTHTFDIPGNYIVRLAVSDGSLIDEATVTISVLAPPAKVDSTVVLFGEDGITVGAGTRILSGDAIVNQVTQMMVLETGAVMSGRYKVKSDKLSLQSGSVVESNVYSNTISGSGTIVGEIVALNVLPVIADLPTFNASVPGSKTISVTKRSLTLSPGTYGDVIVSDRCTLIFSGGTYHLKSMKLGNGALVQFSAPSDVRIGGLFTTGSGVTFGPKPASRPKRGTPPPVLTGADLLIYVGANGSVQVGSESIVEANVLVQGGDFVTAANVNLKGFFSARQIILGSNNTVTLCSYVGKSPTLYRNGSVQHADAGAMSFRMLQNYPNPFNPSTTIRYELGSSDFVSVRIYNMIGQEVRTLVNTFQEAGLHSVVWDGRNNSGAIVSSGHYLYTVATPGFRKSMKMSFIK